MKARIIVVKGPNDETPIKHTKKDPKTDRRVGFKPPNSLFFECYRKPNTKSPIIYDCWIFEEGRTVMRYKTKDQKEVFKWLKAYHEIGRRGFILYGSHRISFRCIGGSRLQTYQEVWRHMEVGIYSLRSMKWIKVKLETALSVTSE